ncbi:MAG: aconitate hydratase AcnA [Candidatus Electryonea clarkiae]|nr:aconitate hydratase AcnA [Candidatus Electryonea clarkiae]MDP8288099.1 aconitate hydratase AcnA [Candidatus Electryonea clarkiae]
MTTGIKDVFNAKSSFKTSEGEIGYWRLAALEEAGIGTISRLPYSIRVLLEALLRNVDNYIVNEDHVRALATWNAKAPKAEEIPFKPARVILQDFTGVPAVVDLAALRSAMERLGGDPQKINPLVPVDLVIDHSVQVDFFGSNSALQKNTEKEFERNKERYEFLRWGATAFDNFRAVPPATGIVHQVNLEFLAKCVMSKEENGERIAFPDSLVGTDSHTVMINGLGVLGWGVGGIEAEAVMLGQPIYMLTPEVIGVKLSGEMPEGATATDMTLTVTEMLRRRGVVGKFVEYFGPGYANMSLADRATMANMGPEYGATMGFCPIDDESLNYLRFTGRTEQELELVERYCKENMLFVTPDTPDPEYTDVLDLDLSTIEPSLAGPKLPHELISLKNMKSSFHYALKAPLKDKGFELSGDELKSTGEYKTTDETIPLKHGNIVIAAITSCTNTSNPFVLIGAGLVAKNAVEKGLSVPSFVKTSLGPGSKVVTEYLTKSGLLEYLEALKFHIVGYGCTTCIGNSGPLPDETVSAIQEGNLVAAAVLSGNRNFEGRVSPHTKANYLASPPLVVAYALAGTVDIDLINDPIGVGDDGNPVYLKDIWPSDAEIRETIATSLDPEMFKDKYSNVWDENELWNKIKVSGGALYEWDEKSTYIQEPPFFIDMTEEAPSISNIENTRCLALLGDSVTTDHISPAGVIPRESPAGKFLISEGVNPVNFNSFGSRRGNDRVMLRGTFANIRLKNFLAPGTEGGVTRYQPSEEQMWIYDAAMKYKEDNVSLVVIAGKQYGTGSSRDWAAKGTYLLGIKAVIAESFERIHRSNLVFMGVLPLQFKPGDSYSKLDITGKEKFHIRGLSNDIKPGQEVDLVIQDDNGSTRIIKVIVRIDTPVEVEYYRNGGILHTVLRSLANSND